MTKRNKNNESEITFPLRRSRVAWSNAQDSRFYKGKSRPSGVRGFESHLLHHLKYKQIWKKSQNHVNWQQLTNIGDDDDNKG